MAAYDVIVIGAGGMGSAACYHLARRGLRVLAIEQFEIGHDRGSSHGQTRIFRRSYFEHTGYVPLLNRAYELWSELEAESDRTLLQRVGLLLVGRPDGPVIPGVQRVAREHGLHLQSLSIDDLPRRFPGFAARPDQTALFELDAGFLRVEECVGTHVELALRHGATIICGQRVRHWSARPDGVRVRTEDAEFSGGSLVIAGGPWSGWLLAGLGLPLEVRRKVQFWFATDNPAHDVLRGCPAFAFDLAEGFFYGMPAIEPGVMKVAEHTGGEPLADADTLDRELRPEDLEPVQRFNAAHLPGVRPLVHHHSVCMYTMTPDEHFVIDRHPQHANVAFAAGFSGHGFKFSALVGSILADLVMNGRTSEPIAFLSLSRAALQGQTCSRSS
jgi:sarcosine oxidase